MPVALIMCFLSSALRIIVSMGNTLPEAPRDLCEQDGLPWSLGHTPSIPYGGQSRTAITVFTAQLAQLYSKDGITAFVYIREVCSVLARVGVLVLTFLLAIATDFWGTCRTKMLSS